MHPRGAVARDVGRPGRQRSPPWPRPSRAGSPRERGIGGVHVGGRLGRHLARHGGDARAARRHPQGHGLDGRLGRRRPMSAPSDIMMLHSVADVQGLNAITEQRARQRRPRHGRHGRAAAHRRGAGRARAQRRPAVGLTMFGVTTPAVQAVTQRAGGRLRLPRLPRHGHRRAGDGGARRLAGCSRRCSTSPRPRSPTCSWAASSPATEDRFGAAIRTGLPYVGSVGALDMVNFGAARRRVPEHFARAALRRSTTRSVTLMRTTPRGERRRSANGSASG